MKNKVVLSGDLIFLGLGDIMQLIGSNGGTGVLQINSKYTTKPGFIYFIKGNIINATDGANIGLDAAYKLFGWKEGDFEFREEDVKIKKVINTNRMEIILDGLRMVDEGITEILGPVTYEKRESSSGKVSSMPIIKGPLVDYTYVVAEDRFTYGQKIVNQDTHGGWIWTILEGVVDLIKETPEGQLPLLRVGDGAFIGSVAAFLFQDNIRHVSALAASNVQLGVLDSQRLSREFSTYSREFRELVLSLDKRLRHVTDNSVDLYLRKDNLKEFTRNMKPVMKQGGKDNKLFVVKNGEGAVVRKTETGYVPVTQLKRGDYFGSLPFLDIGHEPHRATVFATPEFSAGKVDGDMLQDEYDQLHPMIKSMVDNLAICISITTRVGCDFQKKNVKKKAS